MILVAGILQAFYSVHNTIGFQKLHYSVDWEINCCNRLQVLLIIGYYRLPTIYNVLPTTYMYYLLHHTSYHLLPTSYYLFLNCFHVLSIY